MPGLLPHVDLDGLLEYSVVYTDRALNHMSQIFQDVMKDISKTLKTVYQAHSVVVVPGSGTFAMEAVARQLATRQKCLVIRNGWFSFRWTQIFDAGQIPSESIVLKALPLNTDPKPQFRPHDIEAVVDAIRKEKPALVFAPHVETAAGMILPDDYLEAIASATHEVGGLFVLDCVASGAMWVNMEDLGIDVLITAPQKGWSGSPCCGLVMLGAKAEEMIKNSTSTSFSCDLRKWLEIMEAYLQGGHAYHATLPTDALKQFCTVMKETESFGFTKTKVRQEELGSRVRDLLGNKGYKSVAAQGFGAPGVVVCHVAQDGTNPVKQFMDAGLQIAGGVPLKCDEPDDFQTFRIGLFGLDKLSNVDRTVSYLAKALDQF